MGRRVLVVEDGFEYSEILRRFGDRDVVWDRAGSGPEALAALAGAAYDGVVLDMRFDRVPEAELLGDVAAAAERFNGDAALGRRFLEDHQGTYILAALRDAGHLAPVLLSHDFTEEPRRWERLVARYAPLAFLRDGASPDEVSAHLARWFG